MIKAVSLFSTEIDDIAAACQNLKTQLDQQLALLRNTVGIIQCDPEFIEAGIIEPLSRELGIPLVGGTTTASATNQAFGGMVFSMLVLTSDDVEFAVSHTTGLAGDYRAAIGHSLKAALLCSQQPLKLALVFPPISEALPGDCYIEAFESVCGNVPVIGSNPMDDHFPSFDRSLCISNGQAIAQEMSYVLFFGNVNPRFFVASVPAQANLSEFSAIITQANDNIVYEVNNMPVVKYLESVGLAANGILKSGTDFLPLLVSPNSPDSNVRPYIRALIGIDENGHAVCRGKMPEGAQVAIGSYNGADVMCSTADALTQIANTSNVQALFIFSCMVRQLVIGVDSMKELQQIQSIIPSSFPFIASYAGGEICPVSVDHENRAQNCFHNYSFIACVL